MSAFPAERTVVPEHLDSMRPDAPEARASRRDLHRINALMLQSRILAGLMKTHVPEPPRRIVELGCGDGLTTHAVLRRLAPAWPGGTLTLVDAQPVVLERAVDDLAALGWRVEIVTADVVDWLPAAGTHDLAIANLFLHHFNAADLSRVLDGIAGGCETFVATEPRRSRFAAMAAGSLHAIGANAVTRHDAVVSVKAGFRDGELAASWPGAVIVDAAHGPFTQAFVGRPHAPAHAGDPGVQRDGRKGR
ncbi:class I SAM-dependent methyltransferase [Palleronia sp.]|uniref:class I SAM-dependent methyltransferase n=1 Tax=Palleronia sp. TaxID=1940284 RepID=UPI0035C8238D